MTQLDLDLKELCAQPRYRRVLLHFVRLAGILSPSTGAIDTLQFREGMRSLGMEMLREAARGLPRGSAEKMLALLLTEPTPKETEDDPEAEPAERD